MEQLFSTLATKEVKRLTGILKTEKELVDLYRSYPAFDLMYQQYQFDTSGTYTRLCQLCAAWQDVQSKSITAKQAYALYSELKNEI